MPSDEEVVREYWKRVNVPYPSKDSLSYWVVWVNGRRFIGAFHGTVEDAWSVALTYTQHHQEQVRQLDEEIALIMGWRHLQANTPPATRLLTRLQKIRAELTRGMKGGGK